IGVWLELAHRARRAPTEACEARRQIVAPRVLLSGETAPGGVLPLLFGGEAIAAVGLEGEPAAEGDGVAPRHVDDGKGVLRAPEGDLGTVAARAQAEGQVLLVRDLVAREVEAALRPPLDRDHLRLQGRRYREGRGGCWGRGAGRGRGLGGA